jgi:hypothetical protein
VNRRMKSWTAGLGMVVLLAAVPAAVATIQTPGISAADACAEAGGRHVEVGGCTDVVNDVAVGVAVAGDDESAAQAANGQPPCYTPSGVAYYTPGDAPCT